jgi:hypothetical protein
MEALLMRDWKWWVGAALLGGGAVAVACSSSSSSPSDGGAAEAGVDTGAVKDGTSPASDGGHDAAMATCEAGTNVATINSGPAWTCLEMVCNASLTACAADCVCNNAVLTALGCVISSGGATATPAQTTACFTSNVGPLITDPIEGPIAGPLATCLMSMSQGCATQGMEGGTDGGSDGGDSATASDANGDSAMASDATSDSAMASDATGQ